MTTLQNSDAPSREGVLRFQQLACPGCLGSELELRGNEGESSLLCRKCGHTYRLYESIPSMIPASTSESGVKKEIQNFWKELYHAAYEGHDRIANTNEFMNQLVDLERLFLGRQHLAVTEMPYKGLKGKRVLEIGPGAGGHSSLFRKMGAEVVAMDITLDRVFATHRKLNLIPSKENFLAIQGDGERLPFADNSFDIVYSNGVLHHTPNTDLAIREVHRVLRPGGEAVIMLYAKHSYLYWINIFLLRGILLGNIFRGKNWLGRVTEWMSNKKQRVHNPETKVFTAGEIKRMFSQFRQVGIRKNSFSFHHLPFIGGTVSRILGKFTGVNNAGLLIYDRPWRNETKFELFLGRYIGFCLNIRAKK